MADIAFTVAEVKPQKGAVVRRGVAGATITPGQLVYEDGANGWKLANGSAAASSRARGLAVSSSHGAVSFASGETFDIVTEGPVQGFAAMTPGAAGFVSDTAGAIDGASAGTNLYIAGWAESATVFYVKPGLTQSEALFDGDNLATTANANVVGGIPVIHRVDIAAGAIGNTDVVLTYKTRVIDVWLVLRGAGVATTTLQVKNGANAITDAMAASGSDQAVVRCTTLNDAYWEIAAGGTLRVTSATGASQPDATVFVLGVPVA